MYKLKAALNGINAYDVRPKNYVIYYFTEICQTQSAWCFRNGLNEIIHWLFQKHGPIRIINRATKVYVYRFQLTDVLKWIKLKGIACWLFHKHRSTPSFRGCFFFFNL